jgi:excinuclease ABC subunit C
MDHDSSDTPEAPAPPPTPGSQPDLPPQELAAADIDPATVTAEDEEEARLPEVPEETNEAVAEGPLALGHAAIERAVRLAPTSPGVYRMLNAAHDVL